MFLFPNQIDLLNRMQLASRDVRLLRLLFSGAVSAEEKGAFCKTVNIDDESAEFTLMLARLCHRHGYEGIAREMEPRIRGTARFYLFKNGGLYSSFGPLGRALNGAGIPMLLLKGAAVKAAYDRDSSRCMTDIDFAVPRARLGDAIALAEREGYRVHNRTHHSVDLKQGGSGLGSVDVHCKLLKMCHGGSIEEELADRARQMEIFDVSVWVPRAENLLFQLMENELFNLCMAREDRRRFKWVYDCGMILSSSPAFDWGRVRELADRYHLCDPIRSLAGILGDLLPQFALERGFFDERGVRRVDTYTAGVFQWRELERVRIELNRAGRRWRSLFLKPLQMGAEYRFLRMDGTVGNLREYLLLHCGVNSISGVWSWLFGKLRRWARGDGSLLPH